MDWAQILVIILSLFLAIFIALAVILILLLVKVTHQIKSVTSNAQRTVDSIDDAVKGFGRVSSLLVVGRTVLRQLKKLKKK